MREQDSEVNVPLVPVGLEVEAKKAEGADVSTRHPSSRSSATRQAGWKRS